MFYSGLDNTNMQLRGVATIALLLLVSSSFALKDNNPLEENYDTLYDSQGKDSTRIRYAFIIISKIGFLTSQNSSYSQNVC